MPDDPTPGPLKGSDDLMERLLRSLDPVPPEGSDPGERRLAYADPPYLGLCSYYQHRHEEPWGCWDETLTHADLFAYLADFDGWAMSCHSPVLGQMLALAPPDTRVAAWVKPFASFKPSQRVAYAWEPVLYRPARGINEGATPGRDFLAESITLKKGLTGAKPEKFCRWVAFTLLGYVPGDELTDIFPGTGVMDRVLAQGVLL